ncbi:MAG: LL-diaminopimelate aminotransferase [Deltaproteobacteria bacterium]|nr:LL-diaminopimelate aminotransferase [Deltaproteobacteria bacterium]MCL5792622.1 LL-diaminopimelate aminotransferase [Deltaproteobacteria bacterium]
MSFKYADRLYVLPSYLFAELDRLKSEYIKSGKEVIDLGVGDPDIPTSKDIVEALKIASEDPANHIYPSYSGMDRFREVAAEWFYKRFNVKLDYKKQILSLIGSKEGIAHFPIAFVNPGDVVLYTEPGYPVYFASTIFAGGNPYPLPLIEKNRFLPDLNSIPERVLKKTKLLFINYPNNPTSAVADHTFFKKIIEFAKVHNIIVAHDAAYSEMYFKEKTHSILEYPGAMDVAIEFHSLSKTFSMTGWRIGFACGNDELIAGLGKIKTNIDSGVFQAVQWAGIKALTLGDALSEPLRECYHRRVDMVTTKLIKSGLKPFNNSATFYIWTKLPDCIDSTSFTMKLLQQTGVVVSPGIGFGKSGEGYFRMSVTNKEELLEKACEKIDGFIKSML